MPLEALNRNAPFWHFIDDGRLHHYTFFDGQQMPGPEPSKWKSVAKREKTVEDLPGSSISKAVKSFWKSIDKRDDQPNLQPGAQPDGVKVYTRLCSFCKSMSFASLRNLEAKHHATWEELKTCAQNSECNVCTLIWNNAAVANDEMHCLVYFGLSNRHGHCYLEAESRQEQRDFRKKSMAYHVCASINVYASDGKSMLHNQRIVHAD
jgi:hypothetical protein